MSSRLCLGDGCYVDEAATVATFGEEHGAIYQGVERVILAHAYIETGVMYGSTLALDDVACLGELAAKNLNTQTFAF